MASSQNSLRSLRRTLKDGVHKQRSECVSSQIIDLSLSSKDLRNEKYMEARDVSVSPLENKKNELKDPRDWKKMFDDMKKGREERELALEKRLEENAQKRIKKKYPKRKIPFRPEEYNNHDIYPPPRYHLFKWLRKEIQRERTLSLNYILSKRPFDDECKNSENWRMMSSFS
ncbi:hypothetical protein ACHQM5_003465 [Ranunculus cassubicifolius]